MAPTAPLAGKPNTKIDRKDVYNFLPGSDDSFRGLIGELYPGVIKTLVGIQRDRVKFFYVIDFCINIIHKNR